MKITYSLVMGVALWVWGSGVVFAAEPLKRAVLTEIHNDVVVVKDASQEQRAALKEVVQGQDVVRTGKKSRAELEFADKSIARLGSNTLFSFDSAGREMNLKRGAALIHVPPGLSGAKISTSIATAAVFGDVVAMRVNELGDTQVLALSRDKLGPISVTFHRTGETCQLEPGQMLTLRPNDVHMPVPNSVNVEVFLKTSCFVKKEGESGFSSDLPESAKKEIQQAQDIQNKDIRSGVLEGGSGVNETDGHGHQLNMASLIANIVLQQNTTRDRFFGDYAGNFADNFSGGYQGNVHFTINRDGSIAGSGIILTTSQSFSVRGSVNSDGSFNTVTSFGTPVVGQLNQSGSDFTGTAVHNHATAGQVTAALAGSKI